MKSYLRIFVWLAGPLLVFVLAFNAFVDPYGVLGIASVEGVNRVKPVQRSSGNKLLEMRCEKPSSIILGTSRANTGLDPAHPGFSADPRPTYNFSFQGSNSHVLLRTLQYAQEQHPLKEVAFGIDFESFNIFIKDLSMVDDVVFTSMSDAPALPKAAGDLKMAVSFKTTTASIKTLMHQADGAKPCTTSHGFGGRVDPPVRGGTRGATLAAERLWMQSTFLKFAFEDNGVSSFDAFAKLVRYAREQKIALRIFMNPAHARHYELIRVRGLWPRFDRWKRDIVRIIEDDAKAGGVAPFPLWDFAGVSELTSEPIPAAGDTTPLVYFREPLHYRRALGDVVLDRVLGFVDPGGRKVPGDFGVRLTSANLDAHLTTLREALETWRAAHPEDVREMAGFAEEAVRAGAPPLTGDAP